MFGLKCKYDLIKERVILGLNDYTHVRPLGLTQDGKFKVQVMNLEECCSCGSVGEVDCISYELEDSKLIAHLEVRNKKIGNDIWYSGASGKAYCAPCIGVGRLMIENKS